MVYEEKNISLMTVEPVTTNTSNQMAPNVFDTPNTLSPAASRDSSLAPVMKTKKSYQQLQSPSSKPQLMVRTNEADLEKGTLSPVDSSHLGAPSPSYNIRRYLSFGSQAPSMATSVGPQECSMWPSKQTLKLKAQEEKGARRAGNCYGLSRRWGSMTKKQKIITEIIAVLIFLAVVTGIGVGVSRAVGGGVYTSSSTTKTIPTSS